MREVKRSSQWGTTIFCDDIRQEVGGKLSYMGVYMSEMVIHAPFPATLPKLCMVINYLERPGSNEDPVTIRVFQPEEKNPLTDIPLDADLMRRSGLAPTDPEASDPFIGALFFLNLAPFVIKAPGRIRVVAESGNKKVRLGSILVRPAKEGDPPPASM